MELLLYLGIKRAGKSPEYLSGYAVSVEHHEAWTERVIITETYTDGKGNTKTRTRVTYVYHPDKWLIAFNTARVEEINKGLYREIISTWDASPIPIFPLHINCVSGGGGQRYDWDSLREHAFTSTYKGLYTNYIINSNSIFKSGVVTNETARELGLVDYPSFNGMESEAVLKSPLLDISITLGYSMPSMGLQIRYMFSSFYFRPMPGCSLHLNSASSGEVVTKMNLPFA